MNVASATAASVPTACGSKWRLARGVTSSSRWELPWIMAGPAMDMLSLADVCPKLLLSRSPLGLTGSDVKRVTTICVRNVAKRCAKNKIKAWA